MEWTFLVSLIVTIILGIPAFISLKQRVKARVDFIEDSLISVYRDVARNFSDIKVMYKGIPIKEGLFLLKGFFYSSGTKDVTKQDINKDISIKSPEGGTWHQVKVLSSTVDLNPKTQILGNELEFQCELIKSGDHIYFEALGESPTSRYSISHRITDMPTITRVGYAGRTSLLKSTMNGLGMIVLSILLFVSLTRLGQFRSSEFRKSYYFLGREIKRDTLSPKLYLDALELEQRVDSDSLKAHFNKLSLLIRNSNHLYQSPSGIDIKYEFNKRTELAIDTISFPDASPVQLALCLAGTRRPRATDIDPSLPPVFFL